MQFVLASSNRHKAEEIQQLLPDIELLLQSEAGVESPPETGSTFVENALIKAKHASQVTGLPALADDSGLCVHALKGEPGIYSARYAGEKATDQDNVQKLLHALGDEPDRRAYFYCALIVLSHPRDPCPLIAEARWNGEIALAPFGEGGFGYDPVFVVPGFNKTAAELPPEEKNAISHRGQALQLLIRKLSEQYSA